MMTTARAKRLLTACAATALAATTISFGGVKGTIVKKGDRRPLTGDIVWQPVSKTYSITARGFHRLFCT